MASHPSLPLYQRSLLWEWLLQWPEVCIILHVVYVRRPFSLCGTLCIAIPEGIMFPQRGCQFDGRMIYVLHQTGVLVERYVAIGRRLKQECRSPQTYFHTDFHSTPDSIIIRITVVDLGDLACGTHRWWKQGKLSVHIYGNDVHSWDLVFATKIMSGSV